jgi:mycothiol synthase
MDLAWRPVTPDDVPAWQRLLAAAEAVDQTGESFDTADLLEELDDPATGVAEKVAAFDADRMVAFAGVRPRDGATSYLRIDAECAVDPERRGQGLGHALVEWIVDRCGEIRRRRTPALEARIHCLGFLRNAAQVPVLEGHDFRQVNWSAVMRVSLPAPARTVSPARWPAGLTVHTYDRTWSKATRAAHNAAFAEHWGSLPWSDVMWEQWVDGNQELQAGAVVGRGGRRRPGCGRRLPPHERVRGERGGDRAA